MNKHLKNTIFNLIYKNEKKIKEAQKDIDWCKKKLKESDEDKL